MTPDRKSNCRQLGSTDICVSPVALGCWPIAGVTTLDTNDADSIATIQKCFEVGINHLDTAHVYGPNGESENLIRRAIEGRRDGIGHRYEMRHSLRRQLSIKSRRRVASVRRSFSRRTVLPLFLRA